MGKLIPSAKASMMTASKDVGLRNLGRSRTKQASMTVKKLASGGLPGPDDIDDPYGPPKIPTVNSSPRQSSGSGDPDSTQSQADKISALGDFAAGTVDSFDQKNAYGVRSQNGAMASGTLSGAGKGAEAGAAFGPVGLAVGAGVGALIGGLTAGKANSKAQARQQQLIHTQETGLEKGMTDQSTSRLGASPALITGNANRTLYAQRGGLLKKTVASEFPENKNTRYSGTGNQQPVHIPSPADKQRAVRVLTMADGGIAPGPGNMANKATTGGDLVPMSRHTSMVQGPSHAAGGVGVPAMNAEVEGGETTSGNFVFSKELGFADAHKPIAKALGAVEKKGSSVVNDNTLRLLKSKEQQLMAQQEQMKAQMGMPNDGAAVGVPQTARKGGFLHRRPAQGTFSDDSGQQMFDGGGLVPGPGRSGGPIKSPVAGVPLTAPIGQFAGSRKQLSGAYAAAAAGATGVDQQNMLLRSQQALRPTDVRSMGVNAGFGAQSEDNFFRAAGPNVVVAPQIPHAAANWQNTPANADGTVNTNPRALKKGGMLRKFVDGGPTDPVDLGGGYTRGFDPLAGIDLQQSASPFVELPGNTPPPQGLGQKLLAGAGQGLQTAGAVAGKAAPFMADIYNLNRQLPNAPAYQEEGQLAPNLVDYSASRQDARANARTANNQAARFLGSGAEIAAVTAANAAGATAASNKVNESEQNANAEIKNRVLGENASISARNVAGRNLQQSEQIQKMVQQGNLRGDALASIGDKIQLAHKEANERMSETDKLLLQEASDPNGVSERNHGAFLDRLVNEKRLGGADRETMRAQGKANDIRRDQDRELARQNAKYIGLSTNSSGGTSSPQGIYPGRRDVRTTNQYGQLIKEQITDKG